MASKFAVVTLIAAGLFATSVYAMTGAEVLKSVNHDDDRTLEVPEAIKAAATVFDGLSRDKGQTVGRGDVSDRVSPSEWSQVNKDKDQTLELDEWLTVARARFDAADANHDGKLDAGELDTPAGQSLVRMIVK